ILSKILITYNNNNNNIFYIRNCLLFLYYICFNNKVNINYILNKFKALPNIISLLSSDSNIILKNTIRLLDLFCNTKQTWIINKHQKELLDKIQNLKDIYCNNNNNKNWLSIQATENYINSSMFDKILQQPVKYN